MSVILKQRKCTFSFIRTNTVVYISNHNYKSNIHIMSAILNDENAPFEYRKIVIISVIYSSLHDLYFRFGRRNGGDKKYLESIARGAFGQRREHG